MIVSSITVLITAFLIACFTVKKIILVSHTKHLFDEPSEERKIHLNKTPNLGGVGIFVAILFVLSFILQQHNVANVGYLLAAALILFTLGITDDLVGLDPMKKLTAQLIVAVLTTTLADYRIENLHQLFGIGVLPYWVSILLTSLAILFLVNAINLIDGINALAASISLLACFVFAVYFNFSGDLGYFYISIATVGAVGGFLIYNITPAKIFMGDTGSLILGFILSILSIRFYKLSSDSILTIKSGVVNFLPAASFLYSLFIIPLIDTSHVFILRLINKKSPFTADRNHIHHMLLDIHLNHIQATIFLISVTISCLSFAYLFRGIRSEYFLLFISSYALGLLLILRLIRKNKIAYKFQIFTKTNPELSSEQGTIALISQFADNNILDVTSRIKTEEDIVVNY